MKEFAVALRDMLIGGLRPDDRVPRNSGYLETCRNVRVSKYGGIDDLSTFTPVSDPFAAGYLAGQGISIAPPFPQIFRGRSGTFLLEADAIYEVTEGANWTVSQITTYDGYDLGAAKAITGSASWHMADFGEAYAFFNGTSIVFSTNRFNMFGGSTSALVVNDVTVGSGCNFRGQMVMGGFDSSDFWNSHWEAFIEELADSGLGISLPTAPGSNYVWWSGIGEGGFFLLYPDVELYGLLQNDETETFTELRNKLFETIEKNQMGFMPMPWNGKVLRTAPLGNGVMVYGDNGVCYMPSVQGTFGLNNVVSTGGAGRSAVGMNDPINPSEHIFIDTAGWLYRVDGEGRAKNLGYREYFEDMLGDDITISYDPIEREYHIANDSLNYILTGEDKVYDSTYLVTSTAVYAGGIVGIYDRPGEDDDAYAEIKSGPMDFGISGIHTVERIIITTTNTATVFAAIEWRMKTRDSWVRTPFKPANYEGGAYFPIRGLEFKVVIRALDYTTLDIDDTSVHFKTTDKRLIRSTFTTAARSRNAST